MTAREHVTAELVRVAEKGYGLEQILKIEEDARQALELAEMAHTLFQRGLFEAEQQGRDTLREREQEYEEEARTRQADMRDEIREELRAEIREEARRERQQVIADAAAAQKGTWVSAFDEHGQLRR